jgi:hypothetical protein
MATSRKTKTTKPERDYKSFLIGKSQIDNNSGFKPIWMPEMLFPFQRKLEEWAIIKGRGAILAECGLGKTPLQLTWAENVVRHTNGRVLVLTPLAVAPQTVREGAKFGIECTHSRSGELPSKIVVTNYQQLHKFNPSDFVGVVADESGILKNFDGKTKAEVTDFMRKLPYRLLCTATPAPNDYIELGTSSEALGDLGYIDMLKMFFKANDNSYAQGGGGNGARRFSKDPFGGKFRFRGHAEKSFWRWVCSWARAVRQPSDLGFTNEGFQLPELSTIEHVVKSIIPRDDVLFDLPAVGLQEQRAERRRTLRERCELAASLVVNTKKPAVAWCHLNDEGKLLEELIPNSVEVDGADADEFKEETFEAFASGQIRVIVSKPIIAGFGLNWQHCAHQTFFPSHSFEQLYQAIRRSWRYGQKNPVRIDMIASEGERGVLENVNRKAIAAEAMFAQLVSLINNELKIEQFEQHTKAELVPDWI